jgi:4-amino-4-deoxy-L-arabinose transferase-like glycosyltransferase
MNEQRSLTGIHSFWNDRQRWIVPLLLGIVLLAGACLRFYQLGQAGVNDYYAATVKSMLVSWKNFFFVAFEPGGSVSVDKPPLGFWIEAASAYFLGVNGFALALPNAVAGVLSIFLVYKLIRRPFGPWAGLTAAAALAVMPVAIATERNNTIDGMLMAALLLAAWAFLQSVYSGKVRWLFAGAVLVGLGFNIKMLQAFLPLPAFYALYFFGAKGKWFKKVLYLAAATLVLLAVSFSWAVAVDLTPAANRPYVDSTSGNSVLELIFGHNGVERLTNSRGAAPSMSNAGSAQGALPAGPNMPAGNPPQFLQGQGFMPPGSGDGTRPAGADGDGRQNAPGMDFGEAGTLRLFSEPLAGEASWLLPFALAGLAALAIALWKQPFGEQHASVILWAGWLLPEALYFSYSQGLMHAYYLIMVGAPIAALAGISIWALWQTIQKQRFLGLALALLMAGGTLAYEVYLLMGKTALDVLAIEIAGILFSLGMLAALTSRFKRNLTSVALGLLLAAMLVAPALWSGLTTFNTHSAGLPAAGPAGVQAGMANGPRQAQLGGDGRLLTAVPGEDGRNPGAGPGGSVNASLLNFLLANTKPGSYLLATGRAQSATGYIMATGRPVLALGGFLDQYDEVPLDKFTSLVDSGQLRYVSGDALDRHQAIASWVRQNCSAVEAAAYGGQMTTASNGPIGPASNTQLYQCGD